MTSAENKIAAIVPILVNIRNNDIDMRTGIDWIWHILTEKGG